MRGPSAGHHREGVRPGRPHAGVGAGRPRRPLGPGAPTGADDRCRRIAAQLRTEPAGAARELADLRQRPGSARLKRELWPVFEAERGVATGGPRWRSEREMQLRTSADWCRTLLERRMLPAWPWYGLLPDGRGTGSLIALWESVRPRLPEVSADSPPAARRPTRSPRSAGRDGGRVRRRQPPGDGLGPSRACHGLGRMELNNDR